MSNQQDLNKQGVIEVMATELGASKAEAERWLNTFVSVTTNTLSAGGSVNLMGFGSLTSNRREARVGRHPQTGEPMNISASMVVKFKAGKALKEAVNAQLEEV